MVYIDDKRNEMASWFGVAPSRIAATVAGLVEEFPPGLVDHVHLVLLWTHVVWETRTLVVEAQMYTVSVSIVFLPVLLFNNFKILVQFRKPVNSIENLHIICVSWCC